MSYHGHSDDSLSTLDGMTQIMSSSPSRRLALAGYVALTVLLAGCAPAYAADTSERVFTIPPMWMPLLAALATSNLTSLVTRIDARPWVKAIVGLVLVACAAVLQTMVAAGGEFVPGELLDVFVVTFVLHLCVYLGILKPNRVPEKLAPDAGLQ